MVEKEALMHALQPLVGELTIEVPFVSGSGILSFQWLEGERFLIQRWTVPVPEAPDGIAIIGADSGAYVQHYFDSRGVHRQGCRCRFRQRAGPLIWTLKDPVSCVSCVSW
jgi:hypothetical protein